MDCEKFEATLIDELYDELDELTSAAAKRHVAGCSRCAALLGGLRATRRIAVLPLVEPSADLEDRILAAAKDAQKVVPLRRRLSRAVSWAGNWAMRPQTAMAAVFLLMVGSSVVLMRQRRASAPASATMTVKDEGEPAASAAAAPAAEAKVDPNAAATAHGADLPAAPAVALAPPATATAQATPPAAPPPADEQAMLDRDKSANASTPSPPAASVWSSPYRGSAGGSGGIANAAAPAGAPRTYADGQYDQSKQKDDRGNAFDAAMALYRAGRFADATRSFDGLAAAGDQGAALWAARSVRDGNGGCGPATARFDQVAAAAFGTNVGYDATLEGARCLSALGSMDAARSRFARLLTVPDYASRAQAEIDSMSQGQVAARAAPAQHKAAAPRPPAKAQAPKAVTTADKASGF